MAINIIPRLWTVHIETSRQSHTSPGLSGLFKRYVMARLEHHHFLIYDSVSSCVFKVHKSNLLVQCRFFSSVSERSVHIMSSPALLRCVPETYGSSLDCDLHCNQLFYATHKHTLNNVFFCLI